MRISEIIIEERARKDFGDIQGLADSIEEFGLLQAIGVTKANILVFGERRLRAHQLLGLDEIETKTVDIDDIIQGEFAENEVRKQFTMSERVAIADTIAEKYKGRHGNNQHTKEDTPTLAEAKGKETIEVVAKKSGFGGKETYRKAKKIIESGNQDIIGEVDKGEKTINSAYKEITTGKAHVSNNSGNNHWYTPKKYTDSARKVMGGIDLDPASSEIANKTVKAGSIFTEEDNGLEKKWNGRVWMNPPYSQPLIKHFSEKLCAEYEVDNVKEAIVLVNNATETTWFQSMAEYSSAICFPDKRIKFIDIDGNEGDSPLQGQAIIYMGDNQDGFGLEFIQYGLVFLR